MRTPTSCIEQSRIEALSGAVRLCLFSLAAWAFEMLYDRIAAKRTLKTMRRGLAAYLLLHALIGVAAPRRRRMQAPAAPLGFRRRVTRGGVVRRIAFGQLRTLMRGPLSRQVRAMLAILARPAQWIEKLRLRLKRPLVRARLGPASPPAFTFACAAPAPAAFVCDTS